MLHWYQRKHYEVRWEPYRPHRNNRRHIFHLQLCPCASSTPPTHGAIAQEKEWHKESRGHHELIEAGLCHGCAHPSAGWKTGRQGTQIVVVECSCPATAQNRVHGSAATIPRPAICSACANVWPRADAVTGCGHVGLGVQATPCFSNSAPIDVSPRRRVAIEPARTPLLRRRSASRELGGSVATALEWSNAASLCNNATADTAYPSSHTSGR